MRMPFFLSFLCVHIYICIYIHIHTYIHTYIYTYAFLSFFYSILLYLYIMHVYIHYIYVCTYVYKCSRVSNVYTHSLPSAPPSSSQPGIFHSATPKCQVRAMLQLYYILCKFLPVRPSALPSFRHFAAM